MVLFFRNQEEPPRKGQQLQTDFLSKLRQNSVRKRLSPGDVSQDRGVLHSPRQPKLLPNGSSTENDSRYLVLYPYHIYHIALPSPPSLGSTLHLYLILDDWTIWEVTLMDTNVN